MTPIFSLRSLLGIFIGLIVGALFGLGYLSFNNTTAELNPSWPPIHIIQSTKPVVYETTVQGRIMPITNDDTFIRNMDTQEQYFTARMDSMPFFEYFSNAIAKQYPQYSHTPEELARMITISYVTLADNPSVIIFPSLSSSINLETSPFM